MNQNITIGKWTFDVDCEKTRAFYADNFAATTDTQCYRNFAVFTEQLSRAEQKFFDQMGLEPLNCIPDTIGAPTGKTMPTFGTYYVFADVLSSPEDTTYSLDEAIASNFDLDWGEHFIVVDRFRFDVYFKGSHKNPIPTDAPDGSIVLRFEVHDMPWLLREKMDDAPVPAVVAAANGLKTRIVDALDAHSASAASRREHISGLNAALEDVKHLDLTRRDIKGVTSKWLSTFAPAIDADCSATAPRRSINADLRAISDILEHASAQSSADTQAAPEKFAGVMDEPCTIMLIRENYGVLVDNLATVGIKDLLVADEVLITAIDYSWTYFTLSTADGRHTSHFVTL